MLYLASKRQTVRANKEGISFVFSAATLFFHKNALNDFIICISLDLI